MAFSTYLANKIIDHMLRNQAFTPPAAVYLSLHTGDPGSTGASEVTGGSYARQAVALDAANAKATANTDIEDFAGMPAVTVTHIGLWDASTNGNFLIGGALTASRSPAAGDTVRINAGDADLPLT
jgi:hypothetical protein